MPTDTKVIPTIDTTTLTLLENFQRIRLHSETVCIPLEVEDYVVQPVADVSPPKWHLAHTTWFFEMLVLKPYKKGYQLFDEQYSYLFNSYYEHFGDRILRTDRGNMSRPVVSDIYKYRHYIDEEMHQLLKDPDALTEACKETIILGLNHEQQHQELLLSDIKYILGHNPLFPPYQENPNALKERSTKKIVDFINIPEGLYKIGYKETGFCYDNEQKQHKVYLGNYGIADSLVTNAEFLEFIQADGYQDFRYWHSDGWAWINTNKITAPMYWHYIKDKWEAYTLKGIGPIVPDEPVTHISYYEAAAYASWKGLRLPTEFEWEAAHQKFSWGQRWEWTESAYLPYPGFQKAGGAAGEYNGKFMVNQKVLRGASIATPEGHSRPTYRNFFQPSLRWQFTGIRLAK